MIRFRRALLALPLLASLLGCPQERPEASRQIPRERIPPAVSLEPPAAEARGRATQPAPAGARSPAAGASVAGPRP